MSIKVRSNTTAQAQPLKGHLSSPRLQPHTPRCSAVSDAPIAFSWTQCIISTLAYVWLLSNYFRTDNVSNLEGYKAIEPNVYINFGPYAYPVNTYTRESNGAVIAAEDIAVWSYKFDTTSLAMRAFAEFLRVSAFPPCLLYHSACTGDELAPDTAFSMFDSLVDAAQYEYFDRVHHYLAPQLFTAPLWRTCRALYYSPELLSSEWLDDICSPAFRELRPFFCDELWTTFNRSCRQDDPECAAVGRISVHLATRLQALQAEHSNATVDMLLVEGGKDLALHRGGLVRVGKRDFDVVTIFRVRECSGESCTTRVIDDYRYEGESFMTDILDWHSVVVVLRAAAQLYYWIRLAALFAGCYAAVDGREIATTAGDDYGDDSSSGKLASPTSPPPALPVAQKCRAALVVFYKIPSQVVIYGSLSPMLCYLLAHAIDSPMVYELIAQKFDSFNGLLQLSVTELVMISSVQMRNVWVLGAAAHLVVRVATQRSWSPFDGIWGMPQFSIALISSLTVFSQFRFIALRWTPVTRIELVGVLSPVHPLLESFVGSTYGGGGKSTPGGIFLDIKAVGCSAATLFVVGAVVVLVLRRMLPGSRLVFWCSHSSTPLTAGVLWPTSALAVSWNDDVIRFDRVERSLAAMHNTGAAVTPLNDPQTQPVPPLSLLRYGSDEQVAETLDDRSEYTRATHYLMNIAMLTDPVAFLSWRRHRNTTHVERVHSRTTQREYCVPLTYAATLNRDDFTPFDVVKVSDLSWYDALTCG